MRTKYIYGVFKTEKGLIFIQKIEWSVLQMWEKQPFLKPKSFIIWHDKKKAAQQRANDYIEEAAYVLKRSREMCK